MPQHPPEPPKWALVVWKTGREAIRCVPIADARQAAADGRCYIVFEEWDFEPLPFNPPKLQTETTEGEDPQC